MLHGRRGRMPRIYTPAPRVLRRAGVSRDAVTAAGTLAVVVIGFGAFPTGHLLLGAVLIGLSALTDSLDGVMARQAGRSGPWGAFLDSTLDRFADAAVFGGLVLWYFGGGADRLTAVLALACLILGSVVPYARARAEGLGMTASGGIAERADRLVAVLVATAAVGAGLPHQVLTVVLGLLAGASAITVGQRMAAVRRQVTEAGL